MNDSAVTIVVFAGRWNKRPQHLTNLAHYVSTAAPVPGPSGVQAVCGAWLTGYCEPWEAASRDIGIVRLCEGCKAAISNGAT